MFIIHHNFFRGESLCVQVAELQGQIRPVTFTRNYTCHAEGSVLVEFGNTKVLCNATVEEGVPRFMKGKGQALDHGGVQHVTSRYPHPFTARSSSR